MRWRFGEFVFDGESRELRRQGSPVHLSPKAFRLLELLLEKRPKALSKDELKDALWPDTFVVETNLANLAAEVREAIGEKGAREGHLRTVHGHGYSFSGDAVEERPAPPSAPRSLVAFERDGHRVALREGENVLGRDAAADVFLDDDTVSRRHARVLVTAGAATLEDLGSKNGTYLRGRRLEGPVALKDRDEILVGSVLLVFSAPDPDRSTATRTDRPVPAG
jgi:DNA-binding winged helix-turn-helix (wHTH) protein